MSLTIGRIVHYWPRSGEGKRRDIHLPFCARVVHVATGDVATLVVDDHRGRTFVVEHVLPEASVSQGLVLRRIPGTWSWPMMPAQKPAAQPKSTPPAKGRRKP